MKGAKRMTRRPKYPAILKMVGLENTKAIPFIDKIAVIVSTPTFNCAGI